MDKAYHDSEKISKRFIEVQNKYQKLGSNIVQALELFMNESNIGYLSINYRVKDKLSFLEKIERKKYENPFEQIEDICGVRVICYYKKDVQRILEIIGNEFDVLESQDKENLLNTDQFGYRSTHLIVKVNPKWLQAPNYRGLENLKTEIQIRTVLMHAWAEIEHKLAYKKDVHIPKDLKRKLYRISAKLEEADEQFEELKDSIINYKNNIVKLLHNESTVDERIELNLDSLQSFLDLNFPDREKNIDDTTSLLDEFISYNITIHELKKSFEEVKDFLPRIESEIFEEYEKGWAQTGAARNIMDLTNENYRENREIPEEVRAHARNWIKRIRGSRN